MESGPAGFGLSGLFSAPCHFLLSPEAVNTRPKCPFPTCETRRGVGPGCNTREIADNLIDLKAELEDLDRREQELDQQRVWVQQSIQNVTDDIENSRLAYVTHEDMCRCFKGDTLLAIQAPSGTQLEVPIPEGGLNGQKKYQIHLKSTTGPINVLLVNKDTSSSSPVVVPVPPPEDLIQCPPMVPTTPQRPALASHHETEPRSPARPATLPAAPQISPPRPTAATPTVPSASVQESNSNASSVLSLEPLNLVPTPASQPVTMETQPLESSASLDSSTSLSNPTTSFEPIKPDPSVDLEFPKELTEMFDPTKECMDSDLIDELMSSEVFAPLLRLSPPPGDHDYYFNLDDSEGVCDLFDVPILNL
ncbi:transcription factor E2F4 [Heptranchias perlo]|uniref:transcription factor E2F4 n=1 Tax=Heptranchias perlo TaxID=212740 RepID=UPI00355960BD